MRDKIQERQLRMAIREILLQEGVFGDVLSSIKTGVGKAYDTVSSALGVEKPTSGLMKVLDDLSADESEEGAFASIRSRGSSDMKALVSGDSQAGGSLGAEIQRSLTDMGFSVVLTSKTGAPGSQIADSVVNDAKGYDLVVAMWGGNDASPGSAADAFSRMHEATRASGTFLIAVGPPPATEITNMDRARQVFGNRVESPDYHLKRDEGSYPDKRVQIAEAIESAASGETLAAGYGIAVHFKPGQNYPDQPDGIHCVEGAEEVVDEMFRSIGIEEIVSQIRESKKGAESISDQPSSIGASDASGDARMIADAYPKMASYADEIVRVAESLGTRPEWLANVINFESKGGDPQAVNPTSDATGLIQFMPRTAARLGTSTDALRGMDGREQMLYVEEYFEPFRGRLNSQEDVYMAVFYPKAMGDPDFEFPEKVVAQNAGIRTPRDYASKANSRARLS